MKKQADEMAAATAAAAGDAEAEAHAKAGLARELYWVEQPDKVGMIFVNITPASSLSAHHALVVSRPEGGGPPPPPHRRTS